MCSEFLNSTLFLQKLAVSYRHVNVTNTYFDSEEYHHPVLHNCINNNIKLEHIDENKPVLSVNHPAILEDVVRVPEKKSLMKSQSLFFNKLEDRKLSEYSELDVTDEEMAASDFGQGSHTWLNYKNRGIIILEKAVKSLKIRFM